MKGLPVIFRFGVVVYFLSGEFQSHYGIRFDAIFFFFPPLLKQASLSAWLVLKSIGSTNPLVRIMCDLLLCWELTDGETWLRHQGCARQRCRMNFASLC